MCDVVFLPDKESVFQFLSAHFPGFDLSELLNDFEEAADRLSFTWTKIHISLSPEGLKIHHELDYAPVPLSVIRTLLEPRGERLVVHEEMVIPHPLQRQGLSAHFMRPYFMQYQNSKVGRIQVYAAMTRGGYAWAKYGFVATNFKEVFDVLNTAHRRGVHPLVIEALRQDAINFYVEHGYDAAFPIYLWAENRFAELLLAGSCWHGELDLNNDRQVEIFKKYLGRADHL